MVFQKLKTGMLLNSYFTVKVGRIRESAKTNVFLVITEAIVKYIGEVVKTGKPKFAGKQVIDQHMCLAKDFKKYVRHN